jgi:error-prone DNA polymerase
MESSVSAMHIEQQSGLPEYAELSAASHFSFLRGASAPESLVAQAAALGYHALALTDECSLAGIVRAHVEAKKIGLKILVGSELRITPKAYGSFRIILLAQNREGYGNLCETITRGRMQAPKGQYLLQPDDVLTQYCLAVLIPDYFATPQELDQRLQWLKAVCPERAWVGISYLHRSHERSINQKIERAATHHALPCVALGQVEMHKRSRKPLHDTLAAIRLRKTVSECGYLLASNAEQHLRSRMRLAGLYRAELLQETVRIAQLCTFTLDSLRYEYPEEVVPNGYTAKQYLCEQTMLGAQQRYPNGIPIQVQQQLNAELTLIAELQYEAYFLTVYDLVKFAVSRGILCQGRGSAANSAVCYCLGITSVDPANGNALFERFISRERNEPPDIDVDFEHHRREEVIQYLYQKYGRTRAALTAVVTSYRPRSALRDSGRALGIDPARIDQVAKSYRWWDGKQELMKRLAEAGMDTEEVVTQQWAQLAQALMGFPRHLSQHPGGFVLARGLLSRMVPIENAAMPERSVVQWDKDDLDAVGLLKVDVLALGMLTVIRQALHLTARRRGLTHFELHEVPQEDLATYDMICQADTVGVFQIESRAQMSMLPRLKPRCFYDLVVEVAIVRPGPIQGGMVHPYLRRRQGLEAIVYPSPAVREVLQRTLGIPIFQEQVMKIAMVAAGFNAGQADALRRSMAAWRRKGGVDQFRTRLIDGLLANGYTPEFADAIFKQIEGFGEYGFPESHAASFALLAYVSAWLKCHEPEAFLVALLNAQPMGFYAPSQLIQDARRHGVTVYPVDAEKSIWDCTLAQPKSAARPAVQLGLNQISGLERASALVIEQVRREAAFTNLQDFAKRTELSHSTLQKLAQVGAFDCWSTHRRNAAWEVTGHIATKGLLREAPIQDDVLLDLPAPSEAQNMLTDYRQLGYTLGRHPLALLRSQLSRLRFFSAQSLSGFEDGRLARACGLVILRQRPPTANGVLFLTLEDETGSVNVIVRASLLERERHLLLHVPLLGVIGVWQHIQGVKHLLAGRLEDHTPLLHTLQSAHTL